MQSSSLDHLESIFAGDQVIPWAASSAIVTGWLAIDQPADSNTRGVKHALWGAHCLLLSALLASVGGATIYRSAAVVATMALGNIYAFIF